MLQAPADLKIHISLRYPTIYRMKTRSMCELGAAKVRNEAKLRNVAAE